MAKDQTISNEEYARRVEWLRRYQGAAQRQRLLEETLAERRAAAVRVSAVLGGSPGAPGPRTDKLPRAVERIQAAEAELTAQLEQGEQLRAEIAAVLQHIPDAKQHEVLYRRYILGQTFQAITDAMNFDQRWIHRLHRRAVCGLELPAGKMKGEDRP